MLIETTSFIQGTESQGITMDELTHRWLVSLLLHAGSFSLGPFGPMVVHIYAYMLPREYHSSDLKPVLLSSILTEPYAR